MDGLAKLHKGVVGTVRWRDVPRDASYSDEGGDEDEGSHASSGEEEEEEGRPALLASPQHLLTAGRDGRCTVLRRHDGRMVTVATKACHAGRVLCAAWDGARDDALQLVTGSDDQSLRVWQLPRHA